MRLKLISCEVFTREIDAAVRRSPNRIDVEFLSKGLHEIGSAQMLRRVQDALDRTEPDRHEAVALAYGLCNNGLSGLAARAVPLVLARAHDCMTLFFGGRSRYLEYFQRNPGTYFKTTGWMERGENPEALRQLSIEHRHGMDLGYEALVEKYGKENADYLQATMRQARHYGQLAFIEMGVEPDGSFEARAREEAERRGWKFDKVKGDLSLLQRLVDGPWDGDDFLVVPPGMKVAPTHDDRIVSAEEP